MKMQMTAGGVVAIVGVVAAIGAIIYLKNKGSQALNAVNPMNSDNVFNQAASDFVGEVNLSRYFDKTYATVDLWDPFNESDNYAKEVWGYKPGESNFDYNIRKAKEVYDPMAVFNENIDKLKDFWSGLFGGTKTTPPIVDEDYRNTVNNNKTGY